MKCNHCSTEISPSDQCKSFRMYGGWVYYHSDCFNILVKTNKNSCYKSINSSQCINIQK